MTWITAVLLVLATTRATRFVTTDSLTEPVRAWLVEHIPARDERPSWVVSGVYCAWCVSVWVAGLAVVLARWAGWIRHGPFIVLAWLGIAGAVGMLSEIGS